jgi:hypothetical protein
MCCHRGRVVKRFEDRQNLTHVTQQGRSHLEAPIFRSLSARRNMAALRWLVYEKGAASPACVENGGPFLCKDFRS